MSRKPVYMRRGGLKPRRNVFDLSYRKAFTCDMGQLIPIMCDECVPGDTWDIGNEVVIRMQPLAAPIMHEIHAHVHYFYIPTRVLMDEYNKWAGLDPVFNSWENFIQQPIFPTGNVNNDSASVGVRLPRAPWLVTSNSSMRAIGSLWDYFGFPIIPTLGASPGNAWVYADTNYTPIQHNPLYFPWIAYNLVYNEYYRDQDLQSKIPLGDGFVLNRNWHRDYFTCSRPFMQKGVAPALPVNIGTGNTTSGPISQFGIIPAAIGNASNSASILANVVNGSSPTFFITPSSPSFSQSTIGIPAAFVGSSSNATFGVSDIRLATQLQKWQERNSRGGTRYTEFLRMHFGVSPTDSRLDRPEYIGGSKQPVLVNEVLQTSETNTDTGNPLGQYAGHGLSADGSKVGKYHVQEYGYIIGLLSVMPKAQYQDGINRQWLRHLPTDFYFPEFAHLSEQGVYYNEVQWFGGYTVQNVPGVPHSGFSVFGYTGQYDEMRVKHDMVCSELRLAVTVGSTENWQLQPRLSYWNLARKFTLGTSTGVSVEAYIAELNSNFVTCVPRKDIFAAVGVPGLVVNFQNILRVTRPMPLLAEPGLLDHF